MSSLWKLIYPKEATNIWLNPSAEAAGNFAALGAATVTVDTTHSFRGRSAFKVVTTAGAGDDGARFTLKVATNAAHYAHWWMYGSLPATFVCAMSGSGTYRTPTLLETEGSWYHYGYPHAAADANTSAYVDIRQTTAAAKTFWIDCGQVEQDTTWTTYFDGDEDGCLWTGGRHASASYRPGTVRSGGYVKDLLDNYSVYADSVTGYGSPTKESLLDPLALVDGSVYQGTRAAGRILNLTVDVKGTTLADFYSKRKAFMAAISRHLVTPQQPVTWRYTGAGRTVQMQAFVDSGDEGKVRDGFNETIPLKLMAVEDPYWEELAEESATIANSTTLAVEQMVAYRPSQPWSASTGFWDALGAPELTAGTNQVIYCWAKDRLGNLYVGGDFTNLNGIAAADYLAKRDKDGVWSAVGNGPGGIVRCMAVDANNNLYIGGDFTNLTDANGDYISMWNGAAFVSLAGGADNFVRAIHVAADGSVYVGGNFAHVHTAVPAAVANTEGIAKWNGSAWSALSEGLNADPDGMVWTITSDKTGNLYAGGGFSGAISGGGTVANTRNLAKWNGTAWSSIGVFGVSDIVYALCFSHDGRLYAGGDFTTIDSATMTRAAVYNGSKWTMLGTGLNGLAWGLAVTQNGNVYAAGAFTIAGGVSIADRVAMWNGTTWSALPIDLPGAATVYALLTDGEDVYFGFDTEGNATITGLESANGNANCTGTAPCYPVITIACTVAACTLQEVKNWTTGHVIRFNRAMLVGETITIDTRTGKESVRSDFPPPNGAQVTMLMPSDLGTFCLMPGNNWIGVYAPGTGATVTVQMYWRIKHEGVEGGAT